MAGTINTANLSASFDVTKLKEGMNATRAEINKLGSILRQAEPSTNKLNRDLNLLKRAFSSGAIDAGQFANAINNVVQQANLPPRMQSQVEKLSRSFMEGRIDIDQYRASLDRLQTRMNTLDGSKAEKEIGKGGLLAQARGKLGNIAGGMLAGFGVGAGANLAKSAVQELDAIGDAAAKAGVSFAEMITLEKTLAEVGGVEIGQVRSAIGKMTINLVNARDKGGELSKSLQSIGLDAAQLANMDAVTAFGLIAEHSQRIEGHANKMQFATQLFGKAGVEMVPAFDVTRSNLAEMESHLRQMNLLLSQEQAANVGAMGDQMERVRDLTLGLGLDLANTFGPMFENIIRDVKDVVAGFRKLRDLVQGFPQFQAIADPDAEAARRVETIQADRAKKTEEAFQKARELNKELGWTKDIEKFIDDIKSVQGTGQRLLDAQGLVEVLEFAQQNREERQAAQDEFAAQMFAEELDATLASLEQGLRSIEQDRIAKEAAIAKQSDQMQRELDRESQRKIGEADTNIAPAIRAGTVEAYKMLNRQNEDARHRAEHMHKLDAMKDELRKFNERNTVVLSKRR